MKKMKKLQIKKVTLRNLDEPQLDSVAGATGGTCVNTNCFGDTCAEQNTCLGYTCLGYRTCVVCPP